MCCVILSTQSTKSKSLEHNLSFLILKFQSLEGSLSLFLVFLQEFLEELASSKPSLILSLERL